jgi:hypothetical protein
MNEVWAIFLALVSPSIALLVGGFLLSLRAAVRSQARSRWGLRLSVTAWAWFSVAAAFALTAGVASGQLLWLAAIGGAVFFVQAVFWLVILRENWPRRSGDSF